MKTLKIKKLEFLLIELNEGANELSNYGNSKEKARGCGMKEVIDQVRDLYKNEYLNVLKLDIDNLLVSYIDGSDYYSMIESFTNDSDKIDFIVIELNEYYKEFVNSPEGHDPAQYYINNIIRILNN